MHVETQCFSFLRSWQALATVLATILSRSCHDFYFAFVRSYQVFHVSKKNFTKKSMMAREVSNALLDLENEATFEKL